MKPDTKAPKKRILIFSLAYYPKLVGGAEVAVKEITDRISPADIEFDMIAARFDKNLPRYEKIGNVNVYRVGFTKRDPSDRDLVRFPLYLVKIFFPITSYFTARKLYKKNHYDAMWSIMSYMGFPAIFMKWSFPKLPLVLTLQEGDSIEHVSKRLRIRVVSSLYKKVFKRADNMQAISHYLAEFARDMGYERKIEVIPNGVDIAHFSRKPADTDVFSLKEKLAKKYTDTFIITASRLVPKNAVEDIIMALTFLPPEVKLLIAGSGPESAHLRELASKEGLTERVYFLGFISHADLPNYLKISDVFVRPSVTEGLGNSFLEAMAAGLPVVGTEVGGIVDFLEEGKTGLFCHVHDPKSIADAVARLIHDRKLRESIVANAKRMVFDSYDWANITSQMRTKIFAAAFDKKA